jgi:hypothetical protein
MSESKLVWAHFQDQSSFAVDRSAAFLNNKCFFVPADDPYLLAMLNSRCFWLQLISMARIKRGGYIEAEAQYVAMLAMPSTQAGVRAKIVRLCDRCTQAAERRFEHQSIVRHRIFDLAVPDLPDRKKLSRRLENWHDLDFAAFRAEIKRVFHTDIPVKERTDWEKFLAGNAAEVRRLTKEIETAEHAIDAIIYRLFDLTPEEIALLGSSLG